MTIQYLFKITMITLAGVIMSVSCSHLDLDPISQETTENAYTSGPQIESALIGVYKAFHSSSYYAWDHVVFSDIRSDNFYAGGDNPEVFMVDEFTVSSTHSKVYDAWQSFYNAISRANLVLEKTPLIKEQLTEERRMQIMGEAYFLRAYHYFTLVKLFGDVPIVLQTFDLAHEASFRYPSRSTQEEVYEQIIADLNEAEVRLPDVYATAAEGKARATKGAVHALLAKVAAQRPVPQYADVIHYVDLLVNSPAGYSLLPDFDALFDGNHYNNAESILEIQYIGGTIGNWGPQMQLPPSLSGDTWRKFATPSQDLVKAFDDEGDVIRKNATLIFEQVSWIDEFWGYASNSSIPFAYKWRNAGGWNSPDHVYILRLADLMLLKAEAYNELGNLGQALVEVNKIRARVHLPDLTPAETASKETMKKAILKERRLELVQEAHRWDDLVRTGMVLEVMNNTIDVDLRTNTRVNYQVTQRDMVLPIPQIERGRNPNLTQNLGY